MDHNIPPYLDFPEYNEFSQSYLWPVTVKYKGQPEIHFSVSKSDTIKAFHSIENSSEEPILISSHSFERKNLDFMAFEGRTYIFFQLSGLNPMACEFNNNNEQKEERK